MFMKKLAAAAALVFCAFGASASNFRAADQVYVPVAGKVDGATGVFTTDVYLANLSGDPVDVSVVYIPIGTHVGITTLAQKNSLYKEYRNKIQLKAFERKEFPDFFNATLGEPGFGMLLFNGCRTGSSCGSDNQDPDGDSDAYRSISVQTRIYQVIPARPNETTGQLMNGIPWYHYVTSLQGSLGKVFITGFKQTGAPGEPGTFRSNIGVVSSSEFARTNILIKLYQGSLTETDKKAEKTVTLGPFGNQQYSFSELFPGFTGSNYFVTVEQNTNVALEDSPSTCQEGCPGFFAYGSVLDNASGDATTLEAQYLLEMDEAVLEVLYPISSGKKAFRRAARH